MSQDTINLIKSLSKNERKFISQVESNPTKWKSFKPQYDIIAAYSKENFDGYTVGQVMSLVQAGYTSAPACPICGKSLELNSSNEPRKFCSNKCKLEAKGANNSRPVIIDGVVYGSINDASRELNLERWQVVNEIMDSSNPDYKFTGDHDSFCLEKLRETHPKLTDREYLQTWKDSRAPMKVIMQEMGIKTHATVKLALLYFGIETSFDQLPLGSKEKLEDKEWVKNAYDSGGTSQIIRDTGCSPSLALRYVKKHDIPLRRYRSNIELYLSKWLEDLGVKVEANVVGLLRNTFREIDIFLPEYKVSIELDGLTFHGEIARRGRGKSKRYHQAHSLMCIDAGITPLRFTDFETMKKLSIVKSIIKEKLKKSDRFLHAVDCSVRDVDGDLAEEFFGKTHIWGFTPADRYVGLFYNSELVTVMSFRKPKENLEYDWEIVQHSHMLNTSVPGGVRKAYDYFSSLYSGQSIIAYSDIRINFVDVYNELGMNYVKTTGPDYHYCDYKGVYNHTLFNQHNIQMICSKYNPELTDAQNAFQNNFIKYWGCGYMIFTAIL